MCSNQSASGAGIFERIWAIGDAESSQELPSFRDRINRFQPIRSGDVLRHADAALGKVDPQVLERFACSFYASKLFTEDIERPFQILFAHVIPPVQHSKSDEASAIG